MTERCGWRLPPPGRLLLVTVGGLIFGTTLLLSPGDLLRTNSVFLGIQAPLNDGGDLSDYAQYHTPKQVMAARRSLVLETCMQYVGHGVQKPANPYFASKFFPSSLTLAEEEGLAWCRLGKVATTAWSAFFLLLREVPMPKIKAAVANLTAHDLLKEMYPSRPSERMHMVRGEHGKQYFKFIVVRQPFVRLVSAYRDKLETLTEYNIRYHMKDALKMTGRRVYNSSVADSPTFPEFIEYIIRTPPNLMDKHWAPYSKVCLPCNISYDAILKLESLEPDSTWLFQRLGLQRLAADWAEVAGINRRIHAGPGGTGGPASEDRIAHYLGQVARADLRLVYEKYRPDFEMFGYDGEVEEYIQMGRP